LGMALDVACASGKPRQTRSPAVPAECPERTDWCTVKGGHTTSPAYVLSVPSPNRRRAEPEAREELINRRRLEPKHQYRCVDTSIRLPRKVRRCGGCGFLRRVRSPPKNDEQCTESNNVSNNYVPAVFYPQNDRFSLGVQVRYRDSS